MSKEKGLNSCKIYQRRWRRRESKRNEISQSTSHWETASWWPTTKREKLRKVNVKRNEKRLKYQRRQGTDPKLRMKLWQRQKPTKSSDQFLQERKADFATGTKRRENLEGIGRQCKQVRTIRIVLSLCFKILQNFKYTGYWQLGDVKITRSLNLFNLKLLKL